jgi:hypothetical protein
MGEKRNAYWILARSRKKETTRTPRRRLGVVLKLLIEIYDEVVWTGLIWLRIGASGRFL